MCVSGQPAVLGRGIHCWWEIITRYITFVMTSVMSWCHDHEDVTWQASWWCWVGLASWSWTRPTTSSPLPGTRRSNVVFTTTLQLCCTVDRAINEPSRSCTLLFVEESVVFVFTFSVFTVHLALCLNRFNKQKALNRSGLLQAWHCATSRRLVDSSTVQDDQHPDAGARPGLPPPRTLRSLLLLPDQVAWLPWRCLPHSVPIVRGEMLWHFRAVNEHSRSLSARRISQLGPYPCWKHSRIY